MNIEEAIKNLKVLIGLEEFNKLSYKENKSIETLLTAYEKEKESNKKLDKEAQGYLEELAGDGSMNIRRIQELEAELEKEKETSHYNQSQLDIANAKLVEEKEKNKNAIDFINERKKIVNTDMAEGTRLQVGTFMWQVDELLEILKGMEEE